MKRFAIPLIILLVFLGVGCGPKPNVEPEQATDKSVENIPDWYKNPPSSADYIYAVATATSKDMQLAVDKATQQARSEVAKQMDLKIEGLTKKFDQEVGLSQDAELLAMYTQASKTVVSTTMTGSRVSKQDMKTDNGVYRSFVLVELPVGPANAALLEKIKSNQTMYTRFQESNTFKELGQEVEKYEQFKKDQEQGK